MQRAAGRALARRVVGVHTPCAALHQRRFAAAAQQQPSNAASMGEQEKVYREAGSKAWGLTLDPKTMWTSDLTFQDGRDRVQPLTRVLDLKGSVVAPEIEPELSQETARRILTNMIRAGTMDTVGYDAQRQGRLSFYMTQFGEEAAVVGCAAALNPQDMIFAQYREAAALLYRGYPINDMIAQCMGTTEDKGKGRQMPIHYGSPELAYQTVSSPLGTQISQATGAGYAYKLQKNDLITMCFFGDGAASEGDFHPALNFAATLHAHTLFFCRNNGYAISTPAKEQYAGDGIFPRGLAYGMPSIRVDGNDVLAVYAAVAKAREIILKEGRPALVEAMTYRGGHHSTSDDASRYRSKDEQDVWLQSFSPITRFEKYLKTKGWWADGETDQVRKEARAETIAALNKQSKLAKYPAVALFEDVYAEMPPHLVKQQEDLYKHLEEFHQHYPSLGEKEF